jgi:site-specific DNA-adenine methylase
VARQGLWISSHGFVPPDFREYREPFVGGGSMALHLKQHFPKASYWMNDLNFDLYCFWKHAQSQNAQLVREVQAIKNTTTETTTSKLARRKATSLPLQIMLFPSRQTSRQVSHQTTLSDRHCHFFEGSISNEPKALL